MKPDGGDGSAQHAIMVPRCLQVRMNRFPAKEPGRLTRVPRLESAGSRERRLAVSNGMERLHTFSATAITSLTEYPRELAKFGSQLLPLSRR
jgi:hypothetical protein